ncbi:group II intron reverse transcriptase/maturase [Endozoicomonas sp. GU-1]|uniref:group II intron reverse transcriptase/maturase n=1 Tax=Endozoicomonas sp. GU-1 TaxID=3009078 RepID=UPI0022B4AB2F|nr:group II intron reverse transcriptase/maturase [Endozoicomonas sp. GU-1]WBA80928.1 group II intron reverse transcriptase/maturase [Endozoicomonas sp. GU-1]WBA88495.1 group II intron reverse transcriptase/maturase [Endozoicomonas sp. GU-1]
MFVSTKQRRIAKLARDNQAMAFTSLNQYMDYNWLLQAYHLTRKDGATGVDNQTAEMYERQLESNLLNLLDRLKSGQYRAPALRRVYIPKGKGQKRSLGIPTFEDKVAQRAVAMLLEPIYEQDFYNCSFGFRKGKSAHHALQSLRSHIMRDGGQWVLDVDIQKYFDTIDHNQLRQFLARRVIDGVVRKLIDKWLKVGILESGQLCYPTMGTPQGGVISPLLANIYLHYVLDDWFIQTVQPRIQGRCSLTRYADDFVMVFQNPDDCRRIERVLPERFSVYGLTLHPEKTQRIDFRVQHRRENKRCGLPISFDFLGFTHYWGKTRKGGFAIFRKTAKGRVAKALKSFNEYCRKHKHDSLKEQYDKLNRKLRGHFAYFGITGNYKALKAVHRRVQRIWHKWLGRRSRTSYIPWEQFSQFLKRFPLTPPRILHQYYHGHQLVKQ